LGLTYNFCDEFDKVVLINGNNQGTVYSTTIPVKRNAHISARYNVLITIIQETLMDDGKSV